MVTHDQGGAGASDWTKEQRAAAAADLGERGAKMLRQGDRGNALDVFEQARAMLAKPIDPEGDYREGLMVAGVTCDCIDAAVAAIGRGEHPPDSLPGQVKVKYIDSQVGEVYEDRYYQGISHGASMAYASIFALLGCKVTP